MTARDGTFPRKRERKESDGHTHTTMLVALYSPPYQWLMTGELPCNATCFFFSHTTWLLGQCQSELPS